MSIKSIFNLCLPSCLDCLLYVQKVAEMDSLSVYLYHAYPFLVYFMPANACMARSVVFVSFSISCIDFMRYRAQVVASIIISLVIDMVNLVFRPMSIQPQPHQSMGIILMPVNGDADISVSFWSNRVSLFHRAFIDNPSKNTCVGIIIQKLFKSLLCKHDFLRLMSPMKSVGGNHSEKWLSAGYKAA